MSQWAIGIDFGGTAIKAAVVDEERGILSDRRVFTDTTSGPAGTVRQLSGIIADLYREASEKNDSGNFAGVGVGAPGAVDAQKGLLSYPPNLPGWTVFALRDEVRSCLLEKKALSLPVFLDNDANVAAYGEAMYGAGREFRDFLMVTLGTGVGGGIVLNRKLYRGTQGTAGEVGFMIIDFEGTTIHAGIRGTLESFIGKKGILAIARGMIDASPVPSLAGELCGNDFSRLSPRHLEQAALAGDKVSLALWHRVGSLLGVGLANVAVLMDIRKFVIGGGISAAGELIFAPALDQLRRSMLPPMHEGIELVPALLGNKAGMYGAAALCFG
ncbi:MAG: ROK family protein [Chlorobium sp.]